MKGNKKILSSALALSVVLGTLGTGASATTNKEYKIQYNKEYNTPSFIADKWAPESKKGLSKRDIAFSYLEENSKKFKLKGDMKKHFKVTKEQADKKTGTTHFRLMEQFKDIPIFGSDSTLALDEDNNVSSFFGAVVPDLADKNINTEAAISDKEAIKIAKERIEKKIGKVDQYDGEASAEQFIYENDGKFYNTYLVKVSTMEPKVGYWHYFIDAANGNVVDTYNAAEEITAFGTGVFGNKQMFEAQLINGVYGLNDTTRGKGVVTNDAKNSNKMVTSAGLMFKDGAAVDAHANAQKVYDYFKKTFDRNSVDDNGQQLISAVHVNTNWNNASWNGKTMSYGDGDGVAYYNFAGGLDVAAHEMAHGVTEHTANLVYRNESGALNESMSDIFGSMVDRGDKEWLIGEQIVKDGRKALRSMSNPAEIVDVRTESGYSPDHWSKRYTGTLDSGGVHINSSINNKAAYLISEGGKHYGVTVKGVGRDATEQIYYRALSKYLTSSSNFTMMRQAAIQAATDLYGSDSAQVKAVQSAYTSVGVNDPSTKIELENGMTKPIYSTDDAIIENLFVETTVDSDRDGKRDRISMQVMRPKTEPGVKVPVIYEISPYRSGILDVPVYNVDVELTPVPELNGQKGGKPYAVANAQPANLGSIGNYYVPRGYGVILAESIGTGKSDGCPTTGDENETLAAKSVIDWLNGSAKAYTADGKEVSADWSTGNVGMTGTSYNGTLPNAVSTTGVKGLKTIIPISAISSWYDYYRSNGAVIAPGGYQGEDADNMAAAVLTRKMPEVCHKLIDEFTVGLDRKSGDYNSFWDKRNFVKDAKNIKASVFVVHGLNDWNVKTKHFDQWWKVLEQNNVPRKMWLHQGGHGGTSTNNWKQAENKWFDFWLYGIDNGTMDEPAVDVQREDKTWQKQSNWPEAAAVPVTFKLDTVEGGSSGALSSLPVADKPNEKKSLIDDPKKKADTLITNPELDNPNRLVYMTPSLTEDVRISGTPVVSLKGSIDRPVSNLTALLVDYSGSKPAIVTRGWMDPQNLQSADRSERLVPNQEYTFKWDMQPDDYVFKKGSKIGLVIIATDYDYTQRPSGGTKITITPTSSEFILPIVGGINKVDFEIKR
nr:Xaa-Pro dipeptidyl-peptidase [Neobacillus soli]